MTANALFQVVSPSITGWRVMLALEFVDPISGLLVRDGLSVKADGLGPPLRSPSGRYAWLDRDPPAARRIGVTAQSMRGAFEPFSEVFAVPAHVPKSPPNQFLFRRPLVATGLLDPPPGLTAVGGQLLATSARNPKAGVLVVVQVREPATGPGLHDGPTFTSAYVATTDARGGFVGVLTDLGTVVPDRQSDGTATLWLRFTDAAGAVRYSGLLPVRIGQFLRKFEPFVWEGLRNDPPP